jgi:nitroreductase
LELQWNKMQSGPVTDAESVRTVDGAITSRRSVRGFLPESVPEDVVRDILSVASHAPSGTNIQPWRVRVLTGPAKERLSAALLRAYNKLDGESGDKPEYDYYPRQWFSPFIERRRKLGFDLYALLGIDRHDKAAMHAQMGKNFEFFGAPVGLIFTIDRRLGQGSWLDYGFFIQSIAVAARVRGLHTCPQAAFADYPQTISRVLGFDETEMLVCGMSMGFEDEAAPENQLRSTREPVGTFATFLRD